MESGDEDGVGGVERTRAACRNDSSPILLDHCERAAGQVAQRVREVGGVALLESFPREVAVAVIRHFAQERVPKGVDAEPVYRLVEIGFDSARLAEAFAAESDESVCPH